MAEQYFVPHQPIIGPSSDGGLLVQNIRDDQAVQVNLTDLPSSKVTVHECHNSKLHFYGECGDLQLVQCNGVTILNDSVSSTIAVADCQDVHLIVAGSLPAAKFQRSKMCSITGAAEKVTEPVETHTCSSIVLNAIHETSAAITAEELLQERMNEGLVERVELLDGIALLQRSPVGWHRYQHLVSQGSVGIGIKEDSRKNFIVASMVPGGAAQRAGTLCVGDVIVGVDDRTSSAFTLAQLAQALAGPVGTLCKILVEREQGVASSTIPILIRRSLSPSQPPQQTRPAQATPPATIISQPRSVMMPFNTGTAAADSTEEAERMYEQMQQMKLRQQQSQLSPSPQAPAAAVTTSSSRDLPVSLTKDIPGAGLEAADVTLHVTVVEGINLPPDATGSCCAAVQLQLLTAAATDVATHFVTATSGQLRAEWQADFEFTREREQLRQHAILRGALLVSRAPGGNDSSGGEHTIWGYFADIDLRALQFRPIEMWCSINLNTPYGNLDTDNQSINSGVPFVKLKLALKPLGARSAPSPPPRPSASPAVLYSPVASQQGRIVEVQRGQAAPGSTVGGIGVQYSKWASRVDPSIPWIISLVVADGPAHKAGVVQGESLLQVDGKEVSMLTTEQIRAMILGVPGSRVRLLLGPPVASPRD